MGTTCEDEKDPFTTICGVCEGESGGKFIGVASIPGAPMSIAWCNKCLERDTTPSFVAKHDFIFVGKGDLNNLKEWAKNREVWHNGAYIPFTEFVKMIPQEEVEKELKDFHPCP